MKVEYIQPFVAAARDVFLKELGVEPKRGELRVEQTYYTTNDITVLIGITGQIEGTVLYGASESTGKKIVSRMLGEPQPVFDEVCESAFAELGNMISGHAAAAFEQQGLPCNISPPSLIIQRGTLISNVALNRIIIPLILKDTGEIQIAVALRERKN